MSNNIKYKLYKYHKKIYNNFIIHTSSEFKDKWCRKNIWINFFNYDHKELLNDLVNDVFNINKNLLKSLFIFSVKYNIKYLSYLIYQKDKENFYNPLITPSKNIKFIPKKKNEFIISSCFTPPDSYFGKYWSKKPLNNLDDIY